MQHISSNTKHIKIPKETNKSQLQIHKQKSTTFGLCSSEDEG